MEEAGEGGREGRQEDAGIVAQAEQVVDAVEGDDRLARTSGARDADRAGVMGVDQFLLIGVEEDLPLLPLAGKHRLELLLGVDPHHRAIDHGGRRLDRGNRSDRRGRGSQGFGRGGDDLFGRQFDLLLGEDDLRGGNVGVGYAALELGRGASGRHRRQAIHQSLHHDDR